MRRAPAWVLQVFFIAAEPLSDAVTWQKGNRYTFRLRPSTTMQAAMLAKEAAKTGAKKWATVAPNYAYGKEAVAAFKKELTKLVPDAEFVEEQWPPVFKIDAGPVVRAVEAAKPEGIFNVTFGGDLSKFVREGKLRRRVPLPGREPEQPEGLRRVLIDAVAAATRSRASWLHPEQTRQKSLMEET